MASLSSSLAEARRIVEAVDAGGVSLERLALRVTSRLSRPEAIEMHDRFSTAMFRLLNTGLLHSEIAQNQAVCRAILDRIERASG